MQTIDIFKWHKRNRLKLVADSINSKSEHGRLAKSILTSFYFLNTVPIEQKEHMIESLNRKITDYQEIKDGQKED